MQKAPNTNSTSFNCPHCGALAQQFWSKVRNEEMKTSDHPQWFRDDYEEYFKGPNSHFPDWSADQINEMIEFGRRLNSLEVFKGDSETVYNAALIHNIHISECYNCKKLSIWIGKKLVHPETNFEFSPSLDMPENVLVEFNEAASIFNKSPKAAAAILRVAIEKLCNEINGKQLSIFKGIGELVKKGLDERTQKALDIVRVTGNDAVHPGKIDLNDTPQDAERLFKLVNLIVDRLITIPKEIDAVYEGISEEKRIAIDRRDQGKLS